MSHLRGTNKFIPFTARQPTSVTPLKSPCFSVLHYNQPCTSGFQTRTTTVGLLGGKRKSSSESMFHPLTKQQITEARIASSMQRLSLENSYQDNENVLSSSDRNQDEGFFEDNMTYNDDDDALLNESEQSRLPQFKLAPDVKDGLDDVLNGILPQQIYKTVNQSCLALIPYTPPADILLGPSVKKNDDKSSVEANKEIQPSFEDEMKCVDGEDVMCIDTFS